jgi:hypothetical protein
MCSTKVFHEGFLATLGAKARIIRAAQSTTPVAQMASSNPADKFARAALVIIDVQNAIDAAYHASHGPRNNVDAEMKIAKLLTRLVSAQITSRPPLPDP